MMHFNGGQMNLNEEEFWARIEAAELISECSRHFSDVRYTQQTISKALADGNISSDSLPAISQFLKTLLDVKLPKQKKQKTANASYKKRENGFYTERRIALECMLIAGEMTREAAAVLIAPKVDREVEYVQGKLSKMFPGDLWEKVDNGIDYISDYDEFYK
jgi:hypothetical protein